jgi:formylglycine-generating enzyme required for sulfatase activity
MIRLRRRSRTAILLTLPFLMLPAGCCTDPGPRTRPTVFVSTIGMTLVRIEPGKFIMGAKDLSDAPEHEVEITRPFHIGKYEVTQAEYKVVMGDNPSENVGDRLPVENVSWDQARRFCAELSKKEGLEYALPTEAEWEYACRAGTRTNFSFGATITSEQADFDPRGQGEFRRKPIEVGRFAGNAWGLFDMHGNVAEWCADWYGEDYYKNSPKKDPPGPAAGKERVIRGGSADSLLDKCGSASRGHDLPNAAHPNTGFRVVLRMP